MQIFANGKRRLYFFHGILFGTRKKSRSENLIIVPLEEFPKIRLEIDLELAAFNFLFKQNPCSSSPCLHAGFCQVGFTSEGYRCICRIGLPGTNTCPGISSSISFNTELLERRELYSRRLEQK